MTELTEKPSPDLNLKYRSYRSVIQAGFSFYTHHFRKFFKSSWFSVLCFSMLFALLGLLLTINLPALIVSILQSLLVMHLPVTWEIAKQYTLLLIAIPVLSILCLIVEWLAEATVVARLKEHHDTQSVSMPLKWFAVDTHMMGRCLKAGLFSLILILVPFLFLFTFLSVLSYYGSVGVVTAVTVVMVALLAIILFLLPVSYVVMKYLLQPQHSYWYLLRQEYGKGLRHWGHIFTVTFITMVVVILLVFISHLPAIILIQANETAQLGLINGDSLGMPDYMPVLTFVTFLLTGFLQFYLRLPFLMTAYYMYGSIENYEKEKSQV